MNTFMERLGQWLVTVESERRSGMFLLLFALFWSGFVTGHTLVILTGLCLIAEGAAMLISPPRRQD